MSETLTLPRTLVFDAVRVTETTAIAAADLMGLGDEKAVPRDEQAIDAIIVAAPNSGEQLGNWRRGNSFGLQP